MFLLYEHDSGVDGWDAKSRVVAVFDSEELAKEYLYAAGYTIVEHGTYYHKDNNKRFTMNSISYYLSRIIHKINEYDFPYK